MRQSRIRMIGGLGTLLAVAAYGLGMVVQYPGRELSLTVWMVAITLLALGGVGGRNS